MAPGSSATPRLPDGLSAFTWMLPSGVSILTFLSSPLAPLSTLMEQPTVTSGRARNRSDAMARCGAVGMTKNPPRARYAMWECSVPKFLKAIDEPEPRKRCYLSRSAPILPGKRAVGLGRGASYRDYGE